MKKTFKIAVAGAGVGVISLAGAGLASAHGPGDSETRSEITDRVATILGVDSAELSDAFSTARDEVRTEQMDARLDQAVADGTITQEDADEIRAWQDSRPEVLDDLKGLHGHRGPHDPAALEERLTVLVEDGTITQADADAVLAWSEARPEALGEIQPDHRGRHDSRRGPGRGFQMRVAPGEDGEIGRFGGFMFRLPPGSGAPQADAPVESTAL
ncbi:MAG: hypothetical protein O3C10_07490 [Chloroflexi bacterium]|nr:hypothetical protein [Chloroflexota bacterium]